MSLQYYRPSEQQPCSSLFQSRLQKMLDQMPVKRFNASGPLTIDPPISLANANGNRGIYFQQKVVQYRVECGRVQSKFDVVEKKWTGLPPLCACRRSLEVTVAVPLCMWGRVDRRYVRDAFGTALVTSATRQATKSCMRGQPFIRHIIEQQRKKVLDEIESSTFDTQLWRDVGLTELFLIFEVEEPVRFQWTYRVNADDVELDEEELRQKMVDHLDLH